MEQTQKITHQRIINWGSRWAKLWPKLKWTTLKQDRNWEKCLNSKLERRTKWSKKNWQSVKKSTNNRISWKIKINCNKSKLIHSKQWSSKLNRFKCNKSKCLIKCRVKWTKHNWWAKHLLKAKSVNSNTLNYHKIKLNKNFWIWTWWVRVMLRLERDYLFISKR